MQGSLGFLSHMSECECECHQNSCVSCYNYSSINVVSVQGREHEWLFASPEGQAQVAQGCSAKRVIVVSLNRGHFFGSLKEVQAELSPLVMDLAPIASRQLEGAIPFMTTQEGIGSRSSSNLLIAPTSLFHQPCLQALPKSSSSQRPLHLAFLPPPKLQTIPSCANIQLHQHWMGIRTSCALVFVLDYILQ